MNRSSRSLRSQLLIPLSVAALGAAACVAAASYWLGDRRAAAELEHRVSKLSGTLSTASFPLSPTVLKTLSELTDTELITFTSQNKRLHSTLDIDSLESSWIDKLNDAVVAWGRQQTVASVQQLPDYRVSFFKRSARSTVDNVDFVAVLFYEGKLRQTRWQTVSLPLFTGLSTLLLLSVISWLITRRLVSRIGRLQTDVTRIASGDFTVPLSDHSPDELGQLSVAVQSMSAELQKLWAAVNRVERQKLIHQMAAGLAHQIRNSLTGARMALDIHSRSCTHDNESLTVANRELETVENYVSRILLLGAGKTQETMPGQVGAAIDDVRQSLDTLAGHHKIDLQWHIQSEIQLRTVLDQRSLTAAVQNLIMNALQAGGTRVDVTVESLSKHDSSTQQPGTLQVLVVDNGSGPKLTGKEDIFESFVSTKPEGLGLGLSIVRRSAETLGGSIRWQRRDSTTEFQLLAKMLPR